MKAPKIRETEEQKRQREAAEAERVRAAQESVSTDTERLLRIFGSRAALSGAGVRPPSRSFGPR